MVPTRIPGMFMDAQHSTSLLIRRMAVEGAGAFGEGEAVLQALEPVGEGRVPVLVLRRQVRLQQAVGAQAVEAPVAPVSAVEAAVLQLPRRTADPLFQAWRSSMHCWRPAWTRMHSSACVAPAARAAGSAIL